MSRVFVMVDTVDLVLMGENADKTGPKMFSKKPLALLAGEVLAMSLGWARTRVKVVRMERKQVREFNKKKDELPLVMPARDALAHIVGGTTP